jgi:hypothetical protein
MTVTEPTVVSPVNIVTSVSSGDAPRTPPIVAKLLPDSNVTKSPRDPHSHATDSSHTLRDPPRLTKFLTICGGSTFGICMMVIITSISLVLSLSIILGYHFLMSYLMVNYDDSEYTHPEASSYVGYAFLHAFLEFFVIANVGLLSVACVAASCGAMYLLEINEKLIIIKTIYSSIVVVCLMVVAIIGYNAMFITLFQWTLLCMVPIFMFVPVAINELFCTIILLVCYKSYQLSK